MTDQTPIGFYHLTESDCVEAIAQLAAKALRGGLRVHVRAMDPAQADHIDQRLWTDDPDSFLPHLPADDPLASHSPIVISAGDGDPGAADVLILAGGAEAQDEAAWRRYLYLFDGADEEAVAAARSYWKRLAGRGLPLNYWQQGQGGWTLAHTSARPVADEGAGA